MIHFKIGMHLKFGLAEEAGLKLFCNIEWWAKGIYMAGLCGYFYFIKQFLKPLKNFIYVLAVLGLSCCAGFL